jgi:nucleotide-binding universal stress UspA family protein
MYETIVVAVDGIEQARRVASEALEFAANHGAAVHGLYVVDTTLLDEPELPSAESSVD